MFQFLFRYKNKFKNLIRTRKLKCSFRGLNWTIPFNNSSTFIYIYFSESSNSAEGRTETPKFCLITNWTLKKYLFFLPSSKQVSEQLLFKLLLNAKMSKFLTISWREWVTFNEMMMMSAFYKTNTLNWIFIKLAHRNNSSRVDMSCRSTQTHYADFEPTSLCSCSLKLHS
jgi:hypothetical protein